MLASTRRVILSRPQLSASLILLFTFGLILQFHLYPHVDYVSPSSRLPTVANVDVPRKIWQTWKEPAQGLQEELQRLSKSWLDMNPGHRYELLTDTSARTYVRERYKGRPDIISTFERITDTILRADFVRYLALLEDGGVYTDIDTDCSRKIDDWIPKEYRNVTSLVVGVEYDARGESLRNDMDLRVQLCQWTIMSKPAHPVMQNVVDRVTLALEEYGGEEATISLADHRGNVMDLTGPRIFTRAILEGLSVLTGQSVTSVDMANLTGPRLIADVLILPVSAFASGQDHSGSKPWGNDEQLMSHHFKGFETWKPEQEGAT